VLGSASGERARVRVDNKGEKKPSSGMAMTAGGPPENVSKNLANISQNLLLF